MIPFRIMAILSAVALACQQVLIEKDDVPTAVRIAEVYMVPKEVLAEPDKFPISVVVYIAISVTDDDSGSHSVTLAIERPSGSASEKVIATDMVMKSKFPGVPRRSSIIAQIAVRPSELGNHAAVVSMDGAEIARAHFTLLQQPEHAPEAKPN